MASPWISIDIEGEKQLSAGFLNVQRGLSSFREPLLKSSALLRKAIDINFNTSGATLGKPWKPLAGSTMKQKSSRKILIKTGEMRRSFTSVVGRNRATIGNNTAYFKFHQSNKPRHSLPRRIMMRIDATRRTEIMRTFTVF